MSSTTPVYACKADFVASGLSPYLQPAGEPDTCSICTKGLACENPCATRLTAADKEVLEAALHYPVGTEIFRESWFKNPKPLPKDHTNEERLVSKLNACGHVFGTNCIMTWFERCNTCPMCRKVLFPTWKQEEMERERERESEARRNLW
ncbi:hypothetical protein BKA58DRAFT_227849 [Alternaria rosae]|uniref:uncharacterized protein n=1 Tax=Alternaria rosae TaxID=1187941 RepID=UPI001E8D9B26|nr:uncharacterized protein BKA58DRAFT_227849 [Alternaria rosae]KAH6865822.1 hypothetical protein BKA58DRAFT_227849 [Alternaria rosae]